MVGLRTHPTPRSPPLQVCNQSIDKVAGTTQGHEVARVWRLPPADLSAETDWLIGTGWQLAGSCLQAAIGKRILAGGDMHSTGRAPADRRCRSADRRTDRQTDGRARCQTTTGCQHTDWQGRAQPGSQYGDRQGRAKQGKPGKARRKGKARS